MGRPREKGTVYRRGRVWWLSYYVAGRRYQEARLREGWHL